MSLEAIRLSNFRGFADVTLPFKPLTVLLGPNSSGKSSFGHSLVSVAHCQKLYSGTQRASLTPDEDADVWPIDLGTLKDLRTQDQSGRVYIGVTLGGDTIELGFGGSGASERERNDLALSYLTHPFASASSGFVPYKPSENSSVRPGLSRLNQGTWWDETINEQANVDLDGLYIRSMRPLVGLTAVPPAAVQERLRFLLSTLTYLRPSRRRPSRGYQDTIGKWQPIGYGGEYTAAVLEEKGRQEISFLTPPSIPESVEDARAHLDQPWLEWKGATQEGVGIWLKHLGLASSVATLRSPVTKNRIQLRVILADQEPRDITELGFGLSQVLPVLTAGILQVPRSLLIIDLPEAHLHPWPQARVADFFCSLALSGRYVLVETHSEMFFHRLRLRAALNKNLLDLISVYFVDEPRAGQCVTPREIGLDSGAQIRWPVGFLAEAWDTEKHVEIVRQARGVRK